MIVQRRSFHEEYYAYLNCGYRLPLVGGTDKMSADVPVGIYRTYANLGQQEFSYGAWARSVREGRTFLSAGPIIDLRAEGCEVGDTLRISGPGTIHISARAESIFPIGALQIVQNGRVAASAEEPGGARQIELEADLRVEGNCWLAARCGGPRYWDAASHPGPWPRGIFAHTSPVYVACGVREWSQFDAGQARVMQALIEGGLERIRHHAVRYPRDHITHHHGEVDHRAFLERPFLQALGRVTERLKQTQSPSTRG
jgi:hypothetical protein